jgi:hypothetical protein
MKPYILLAYFYFMIPQSGKTVEDFRWENRLLIMNFEKPLLDSMLVENEHKLEERKLLVVEFNKGKFIGSSGSDAIDAADFFKVITRPGSSTDWALVGLDGGVKDSGSFEEFSLKQVLIKIDQMPMRVSEMKGKNGF